jgi:hypothetical protein
MAKPKLKLAEPTEAIRPNIKRALVSAVAALYDRNAEDLQQMQEASAEHCISVSINAKIDGGEAEPIVKVSMKFGRAVKDSITARLDDENQGGFSFLDAGGTDDQEVDE